MYVEPLERAPLPLIWSLTHFPLLWNMPDDWIHTIDFIAQNVQLSRLTLTLAMYKVFDILSIDGLSRSFRLVTRDEVMPPVRRLQGLRDLFVQLSPDHREECVAEGLRLERLAMGSGFKHRTKPRPQSESRCRFN